MRCMRMPVILLISAGLALGLGIGVSATLPGALLGRADQTATPVTTDTLEYCHRLAAELASAQVTPADTRQLTTDGLLLCQQGQIRGGILRLRRAMLMLHESVAR
jgi:hypothetical protein